MDDNTSFDAWLVDKLDALGLDAEVGCVFPPPQDSNFRARFRRLRRPASAVKHAWERPVFVWPIFMMMHLRLALSSGS